EEAPWKQDPHARGIMVRPVEHFDVNWRKGSDALDIVAGEPDAIVIRRDVPWLRREEQRGIVDRLQMDVAGEYVAR
ncbi:hypothetical protein AB9E09_35160, partial [Rhizobium leguminosarum]|uniref:hypothetical protein n=1 Tax=Rhizobium leguminosarum TaxID=384 RepID=UPI003F99780D